MSFWRDNGLTIALAAATVATMGAMAVSGWFAANHEAFVHGAPAISFTEYGGSGHFLSAVFENWESEFLQMFAYVCLTAFLFQRGSAESRDPDEKEQVESCSDVREGKGVARKIGSFIHAYSLGIVLAALFLGSFGLHLFFSAEAAQLEAIEHGAQAQTLYDHLADSEFWFESFQNWQSEFLSTMVLVVLSIFLRFRGSPESKPVSAPNSQTGS